MAKGARADMLLRRAILALAFEIILPLFVLSLRFALVDPFLFGRQLLRRIPAPAPSPPRHSSSTLRPLPCILSPRPILPPSRAQGLLAWAAPRCAVVLGLGETYYGGLPQGAEHQHRPDDRLVLPGPGPLRGLSLQARRQRDQLMPQC